MADWTVGIDRCKLEYETAKYTLYLTITGVLWNAFRQNHRLKKNRSCYKEVWLYIYISSSNAQYFDGSHVVITFVKY